MLVYITKGFISVLLYLPASLNYFVPQDIESLTCLLLTGVVEHLSVVKPKPKSITYQLDYSVNLKARVKL